MSDEAITIAYQMLSTSVTPTDIELPAYTFLSMERERSNDTGSRLDELQRLEQWDCQTVEVSKGEISALVLRSMSAEGVQAASTALLLRDFGEALYDSVEFPTRSSPIKGQTLSHLVGGGGVLAAAQLFHSGVTPTEAVLGLVITSSGIILFGVSESVSRALSAGIEAKLKAIFGNLNERNVASERSKLRQGTRKSERVPESEFRDAWKIAEDALTKAAIRSGLLVEGQRASDPERGLVKVARTLEVSPEDFNIVDQIRRVNNDLNEGKTNLTTTEARKYKKLAAALADRLKDSVVRKP